MLRVVGVNQSILAAVEWLHELAGALRQVSANAGGVLDGSWTRGRQALPDSQAELAIGSEAP